MDDEQFERHKEFMLQQQAESAVRMTQMEDLLVRFAQATRERFEATDRRAEETDRRTQEIDEKIAALVDAQIQTEETVRKLGEDVRKTEEAVRNLAVTVDRHIAEGHNGRARPES